MKLSFSEKVSQLTVRLRDPEWRRYGRLLLTGKLLGVGLLLLIITVVPNLPALLHLLDSTAYAADTDVKAEAVLYPTVKASDVVNLIDDNYFSRPAIIRNPGP